ncbi:Ku protein [Pyxidicoccus trucidator]|uniref:non-homologous end joining protein Ku n=1 Tax=Pyxidicoccus trucidator TaxID=2709662 RepID=UPI0013DB043B|nr:Ku protein [Pyxidicoccus trucidator]
MSRPVWVGSLSFGLVSVPVRLYSAVSPRQVQFHLLHDADGARIQNKRVCSADGEEVAYEHVVKGYELGDGGYVEVTRGELEAFDPGASRVIELEDFVEAGEIDPLYYDSPYHLVPAEGAEHAYSLLVATLREAGRVGIGRFVLYHKGHLCAVRPHGRGLLLSTLHYAEEVVSQESFSELALAGQRPRERELAAAMSLVEARATRFEPRRYHDVHRERLLAFIERRAAKTRPKAEKRPAHAGATAGPAEAGDLLTALEQSVAALRAGQPLPPPAQGALRLRPQASAREVRERSGGGESSGSSTPVTRRKKDEGGEPSA